MNQEKKITGAAAGFKTKDILRVALWLGILGMTWSFMHGADHFLALTPEALGKYFDLRWVLIAHITAGGGPWY